nr:DNA repair exonuclease [uncultured Dongia sp.]
MRILHAADIHLDSPLAGLRQRAGARGDELADATRRAFENLVQYAIDQKVDLLVIAGDNYDGRHRDYSSLQFFAAQMRRLLKAGIRIVMIRGNHDAENQLVLTLPEGVRLLSVTQPETIEFDDLRLAIHGQSYPKRDVKDNLAQHYPDPVAGFFNLGVLHTAVEGYGGTHAAYAPCSVKDLIDKRYDYWALGHVHRRIEINRAPWIIYPGNLQARHVKESGAKGATLITVDGSSVSEVAHVPLDVVRWSEIEIDVSGAADIDDLAPLLTKALGKAADDAEDRTLAARVSLVGETKIHGRLKSETLRIDAEVAEAAEAAGDVWIERIEVATSHPARAEAPDEAIAALDDEVRRLKDGTIDREKLRETVFGMPGRFTAGLRRDADLEALDDAALDAIIEDACDLLKARLLPEAKI